MSLHPKWSSSYGTLGPACLAGCDHSHFPPRWRISRHGGRFTRVLVPAASVRVRCCYHLLPFGRGPHPSSRSHELHHRSGFEKWFLSPARSRHNSDHGSALVIHVDRFPGGQAKFSALRCVRDHHAVRSGCPSETTTITRMQFHIAHHCSFRHTLQGQHVSDIR